MDSGSARVGRSAGAHMSWSAVVEVWPTESLLFIPELPGYLVKESIPDNLAAAAESSVQAYLDWLIEGELIEEMPVRGDVRIAQTLIGKGGAGPCFELDRQLADDDVRELALAVGRAGLSDLIFVYDDVPSDKKASAADALRHIAEMDRWYATRMAPAQGKPFAILEDELVQSASLFEETVDLVSDANKPLTWEIDGEEWSIAKVLRRRTTHLREHLPELLAYLI